MAGIVIQVNESFNDLYANASDSPIPVTFINWKHVPGIVVSVAAMPVGRLCVSADGTERALYR